MFVTSPSFRGTFKSFWYLTGKSTIMVTWQSELLWLSSEPDFQNQSIKFGCIVGVPLSQPASGLPYYCTTPVYVPAVIDWI